MKDRMSYQLEGYFLYGIVHANHKFEYESS